jgi:hypothetical protein
MTGSSLSLPVLVLRTNSWLRMFAHHFPLPSFEKENLFLVGFCFGINENFS